MPVLVWHGPAGGVTGRLLNAGHCHIFHEDARDVSDSDLHGLPASWEVNGTQYCCAELSCGHTFHVSALAWHCLYRDMRCPMCRRGSECRMSAASLPARERSAFEQRLADADAADAADEETDGVRDLVDGGYSTDGSDHESESGALAYEQFASLERFLRLVVEVRCGAQEVYVYESPVHIMDRTGTALDGVEDAAGATDSLRLFRVQRSFARHISSRVASCVSRGMLPISLKFSLAHPLFQCRIESVALVSPTAERCDFALRSVASSADVNWWRAGTASAAVNRLSAGTASGAGDAGTASGAGDAAGAVARPSMRPTPVIGQVRLRLGAASVSMALEPHFLVRLWCEGL